MPGAGLQAALLTKIHVLRGKKGHLEGGVASGLVLSGVELPS